MQFLFSFALALLSASGPTVAAVIPLEPRLAICYETCWNAIITLNNVGERVACGGGSTFMDEMQACMECEEANSGNIYLDFPKITNAC